MAPEHQDPAVYGQSDLTYNTYLKVPQLLDLQACLSQPVHHDELLFIIIHQAYELWFKLILFELENAMRYMNEGKVLRAHHFMRRVVEIQKLLVGQIHILETMTPIEFLGFRGHINPASGFQSLQFREIEFLAGLKDENYYKHFKDQEVLTALKARAEGPDLWSTFLGLLGQQGFDVSGEEQVMATLRTIYSDPETHLEIYMVAEDLVDFDAELSLWRFHHVSVVERVIGGKAGTGGSSGASYLRSTIDKKCFPLLWAVRARLGSPLDGGDGPAAPAPGCPYHP